MNWENFTLNLNKILKKHKQGFLYRPFGVPLVVKSVAAGGNGLGAVSDVPKGKLFFIESLLVSYQGIVSPVRAQLIVKKNNEIYSEKIELDIANGTGFINTNKGFGVRLGDKKNWVLGSDEYLGIKLDRALIGAEQIKILFQGRRLK